MSYDVYWVKNRAEKIADFEHPTQMGTDVSPMMLRMIVGPALRNQERVRGCLSHSCAPSELAVGF